MPASTLLGYGIEGIVVLGGLVVLGRELPRALKRSPARPDPLTPWPGSFGDLLLFLLCAFCGGVLLPPVADLALRAFSHDSETRMVVDALASQLGFLAGIGAHRLAFVRERSPGMDVPAALRTGGAAFLAAAPLVFLSGILWQGLLQLCHLPVHEQDQVALFESLRSPVLRAAFIVFATVIAPINEELIFRAGLFRFCRGRMPRMAALLLPAILFGAGHLTQGIADGLATLVPLIVLGVVFSLAYERSGRIGTSMVAHALYNLATIVLLLLGVST